MNAKGSIDDVSKELKVFLDYLARKNIDDSYVERLKEAVKEAKKNREWRHEYMTLLMCDQENQKNFTVIGTNIYIWTGIIARIWYTM